MTIKSHLKINSVNPLCLSAKIKFEQIFLKKQKDSKKCKKLMLLGQ